MTTVGAALVTRNAERWLGPLLASVEAQSRPLDSVVVVDDGSTDQTLDILRSHGLAAEPSRSSARSAMQRTAENFAQAVRACGGAEIVVLGDHDDVWDADRVARQVELLEQAPDALMVASDGRLVDESGGSLETTLRAVFPVPLEWDGWSGADRMTYAMRHSVATGGASALRASLFPDIAVPNGWLHDRWWSLVACAREALLVDREPVISYRVSATQQVGLDQGAQEAGGWRRATRLLAAGPTTWRRARSLAMLRGWASSSDVERRVNIRGMVSE